MKSHGGLVFLPQLFLKSTAPFYRQLSAMTIQQFLKKLTELVWNPADTKDCATYPSV